MKSKMKLMQRVLLHLISILFFVTSVRADIVLTNEEYNATVNRLKRDKEIINENNVRWKKLRESKPKINYEIIEGEVVIQSIEIPIYKTTSLQYEVQFKVKQKAEDQFFPFTLHICAMLETTAKSDGKVGVQFFSLKPLIKHSIGFNLLIGMRSAGVSLSYTFPKPFGNTSIHVFSGISYSLQSTYGIGISANL